ncbi:response regulator [Desulfopila aestuarii]|nr:response regulator [Desulfopila aestuarii]
MKVLVVDNEKGFASVLTNHLRRRKIEADSACSAAQALEYVRKFQPDVLVLDLQMPDISGLDVFRQIKVLDSTIEVILVTGNGSFDMVIACMQLGAFDYLMKPIDLNHFLDTITGAFENRMRALKERSHTFR